MNDYELYHFGILGMHWGIRRYQNEDGTLTEEGKKRYRENDKFANEYDGGERRRKYAEANSKKTLEKALKEATENDRTKNSKKVLEKLNKELIDSKEHKDLSNWMKFFSQIQEAYGPGVAVGKEIYDAYQRDVKAYEKKGKEIMDKHMDELLSANLQDLGYEDTAEGRAWLKKNFVD